jgi:hypothetical protein
MEIGSSQGGSAAMLGAQIDMAVTKKAMDNTREQGKQALQLIDSASPPANVSAGVGQRLNVVA